MYVVLFYIYIANDEGGGDNELPHERRRKHDMLKMYYGSSGADGSIVKDSGDPCDINGANFQPEAYLSKLLKVRASWIH